MPSRGSDMYSEEFIKSWDRVLNPETLKNRIISYSLFITSFELLKNVIVDKVEFFYIGSFFDEFCQADYENRVLKKSKSKLYASLLWLEEMGAINEDDVNHFNELKAIRNKASHEMFEVLLTESTTDIQAKLSDALNILNKIEIWWFQNLDMAIDPESYPEDFDVTGVQPMSVWTLELLMKIAMGNEGEAYNQYKQFCEAFKK